LFRADDAQFVTYLTAVGVPWHAVEPNGAGRVDFVFDLDQDESLQHRVDFTNSPARDYASAYDLVMKVIKDVKRNR
tara:strand:+ start:232 stop:459 length:228 start_codon:yes stop_codon:yes gene_type:complete